MASNITLTSSMRSNLSSLKSLACQMSTTQTRLSTGKRVNSAIDNANSYYQSRALTNRSSDLDMLLDAMGQSIQTITAAVKGLEATGEILENAAVIAQNAYEAAIIPEKAWFEAQVGPNGAVVTTAQELKAAINANKSTICVYGQIDMGEITSTISLRANQKLVGIGYFGDFDSETNKFSSIKATTTQGISMITTNTNVVIADLSINFEWTTDRANNKGAVRINGDDVTLHDIDIKGKLNWTGAIGANNYTYGIINTGGSVKFYGNNNVTTVGCNSFWNLRAQAEVMENARLNCSNNINSHGNEKNKFVIHNGAMVCASSINTLGNTGPIDFYAQAGSFIKVNNFTFNVYDSAYQESIVLEQGVNIAIEDNYYKLNSEYVYDELPRRIDINNDNIADKMDVTPTSAWPKLRQNNDEEILRSQETIAKDLAQYSEMMTAFDELVSDAGYQGVNLLAGGNIDVMFNETRTHSYNVQGKDMSSAGIGITSREWVTRDDIAASIKEIKNAMNSVRDMVETLGNHLSIIQTRMNFTDAMTDILQTGADDLVLADMNEESANYLALQTRNSLAVNALALAAQSNNSVLKLF